MIAIRKLHPIYKIRVANYLCQKGNDIVSITDDENDPTGRYKCIWFVETEKFLEDLSNYTKQNRKEKK